MRFKRKQKEFFSPFLFGMLIAFSANSCAFDVGAAEPQKAVLALYGSRPDLPANVLVDEIIRSTLERQLGSRLDFYAEFMDTARWPEAETRSVVHDFLRRRYAHKQLSAIIAVAQPAIDFMRLYGEELFPGVPIVVYGTSDALRNWKPGQPVTGTLGKLDLSGTVELMLRLQPRTREILVISGASPSDQWLQSIARRQLEELKKRVQFAYLTGFAVEDLVRTVSQTPDGTAILFLSMLQDSAGNKLLSHEVLARIARVARVPVYSQSGANVGRGIVGGVVFNPESLGRETAQLTLRVLQGERLKDLPVQESKSTVPMVDWRQLQRWGLDEKRLPAGTVVQFREASLWQSYKRYIIGFLGAMMLELSLIVWLFVEARKRRMSENKLKKLSGRLIQAQEEERSRIAREIHDDYQQRLGMLSIDLEDLGKYLERNAEGSDRLHELWDRMGELGSDLHSLSHRLHSSTLDNLGLMPALRALCAEFGDHYSIDVNFVEENVPRNIPTEVALCLFRTTQEGLQNVKKHSHAESADVRVEGLEQEIHLSVSDSGSGFDPSATSTREGIGIQSMEERVRLVEGHFAIHSRPGEGTKIDVWVPIGQLIANPDTRQKTEWPYAGTRPTNLASTRSHSG